MIAKSCIARRRGHGLHKDHARSDVLRLLDRSASPRRHHGALVDRSHELRDGVGGNVGIAADMLATGKNVD